jgi:hypothetical protein
LELTYFFGSITIAVICSVQGTSLPLIALVILMVLFGAYVIGHPGILRSISAVKLSLDQIDKELLSNPASMRRNLSERLGVEVLSFQVLQVDYISDMVRLNVYFRTK